MNIEELKSKRDVANNEAESISREVVKIIQNINSTQHDLDIASVNNFDLIGQVVVVLVVLVLMIVLILD